MAQTITGEHRQTVGGKPVAEVVDQGVSGRLGACPEVEDGDDLADGIRGDPQPQHRTLAA